MTLTSLDMEFSTLEEHKQRGQENFERRKKNKGKKTQRGFRTKNRIRNSRNNSASSSKLASHPWGGPQGGATRALNRVDFQAQCSSPRQVEVASADAKRRC